MDIQLDSLDFYVIRLIDEAGQYVELDLRTELAINEDNLDKEMREQPAKYVYWSSVLERIRLYQESANLELESLLGELDIEAREELPKLGLKVTRDSVEGYISRTEAYKRAKEKCNNYDYLVRRLQFVVKSFEQRKDMLQSYGRQLVHDKTFGHKAGRYLEGSTTYHDQNPFDTNYTE